MVRKDTRSGFTMVELLVVLVIVAILAAVAAPIYTANSKRAIASDAVAVMSVIRQAEREQRVRTGSFIAVDNTVYALRDRLGVNPEVVQYFAHPAFRVELGADFNPTLAAGEPAAQDFIIRATGSITGAGSATEGDNVHCLVAGAGEKGNCAAKGNNGDLQNMRLEMDNAGRIRVSYNAGTTWEDY